MRARNLNQRRMQASLLARRATILVLRTVPLLNLICGEAMPLLGAHMSIAGGYHRAVEAAASFGMEVVQLFTKNNNQWWAKEITQAEAEKFKSELVAKKVQQPLSHASYLINLGSPNPELWQKSVDGMIVELERAGQLGIRYVVVHPGAFTSDGNEADGIAAVVRGLDEIYGRISKQAADLLLENTAGQGSCLGHKWEHLAAMLEGAANRDRIGVCFDTCHAFAAGYDLRTKDVYRDSLKAFDDLIGLTKIKSFHLNDSKKGLGSRVDRHEHIGHGLLGAEAFRCLLNDERFTAVPMYLETPKEGDCDGEHWDVVNLRMLRGLVQ